MANKGGNHISLKVIMEQTTVLCAEECTQQWKALWELDSAALSRPEITTDDLFDCSNLITHEKQLVEREVNMAVAKWRSLDNCKVKKVSMGWSACKIRLPLNFDYLSMLEDAPPSSEQEERIVSYINPNETDSYETALWKIFKETRTLQELKLNCGMTQTIKAKDHLDKADLNRCRMSDRHGLPPSHGPMVTTIVLEVWRKQPRDISIDCNRLVIEFHGDQTLLDVHIAIQELTDDGLWTGGNSGLLLIEDSFYVTGDVDYATPLTNWLRDDPLRTSFLGLVQNLETKPMETVKLKSLRWSMNTRYLHVHHGNIESSFFLTDICLAPKQPLAYPIILDVWTPSYPAVLCEGCKSRSAILVTPTTCQETDGTAQICQSCHDNLFRDKHSHAIRIHILKQHYDLFSSLDTNSQTSSHDV